MRQLFLFVFIFSSLHNFLKAGDETRNLRVYAAYITTATSVESHDDKFTGVNTWTNGGFTNYSNRAVVELGLDEEKHIAHNAFKVCAKFDVELTDAGCTTTILTNQQLDINYEPAELTRYTDKAQLIFYGYYKIKVYNIRLSSCNYSIACSSTLCNSNAPGDVYVQAEVTTNRIYDFNYTDVVGTYSNSYNATDNELNVYWSYSPGAESYELEYTYIDNYAGTSTTATPKAASVLNYDLDHDATRICTPFNNYRIPMNYERGYIVYRIRPIGTSTNNIRKEGTWAGAAASGVVSSVASGAVFSYTAGFSADKVNWSSIKTFAELGRTGHGVSFSDALGFNRQTIARNNTESKNIVQSTLYDHHGRPVINFLPAPTPSLNFNYQFGINKYISGGVPVNFDKSIYDIPTTTVYPLCSATGFSLDPASSTGATRYYSSSNTNKEGQQAFVPDAEQLAYTHIKYKTDGSSRISRQSMPGKTHQLGSDKEIKYFYAKPSQVELDRLFGSEAGPAILYYKNFVQDPNGQLSTTYIDMYGRTIATALVGNSPANVDDLPNKPSPQTFLDDLSNAPTNWTDNLNKCKEVNIPIMITSINSVEGYTYNTTLGIVSSPCDSANICFECKYDITISIKDECGEEVFSYTNTPPATYTNTLGASAPYNSVTCTYTPGVGAPVGNYFSLSNTSITVTFPKVGSYTIYKKICVNDDPLPDYNDIFLESQTCVDACDIFNGLMNQANFNGCMPQTCSGCTAQVQDYIATYTANASNPPLLPQQINELYENCNLFCQPNTACEKYRRLLESDFYPVSGQYATTNTASPTYSYSVFKPGNLLSGSPTWTAPASPPYLNTLGQTASVTIGGSVLSPTALTKTQFAANFSKSWANAFLPSHPEYCKLYFYCNLVDASINYDDHIKGIVHYDSACATNYVLPFTFTPAAGPGTACIGAIPNTDPVYTLAIAYPGFSTAINNFTNNISGNMIGSGQDIYTFVASALYGGTASIPGGHYFGSEPCVADAEWAKYRDNYLAQKFYLYQDMMTAFLASPGTFSFSGTCTTVPSGFASHFPNWADSVQNLIGNVASPGPLGPFTGTAQLAAVGNTLANNANTLAAANCSTNCQSYVAMWSQNLWQGCPAYAALTATVKTNILNALQGVCMLGCNGSNPLGASSVPGGTTYTIPGTTVTVTNFQGVLDYYVGTNTCNAVVITNPKPYPANPNNPGGRPLTDCGCDKILKAKYDYDNVIPNPLPAGVDAAWKMFRYQNGYDLAEYNILQCICQGAINTTWTPTFTWSVGQLASLNSYSNIPVSPRLACTSCIKCSDVVTAINTLSAQLLSPVPLASYSNNVIGNNIIDAINLDSVNYILAINSLNSQFGGNYSMGFYTKLYQDCQDFNNGSPPVALTFSNNISSKGFDLYKYMGSLVKKKKFHQDHTTSLCIDDKLYLSSLYSGTFAVGNPYGLSVTAYTYDANASSNNFTMTISNGTTTIHQVKLTAPATYTNWNKFKSFSNYKAYCPSPVAGNNYTFVVDAKYKDLSVATLTGQVLSQSIPVCYLSVGGTPQPQYCKPEPTSTVSSCIAGLVNNVLNQTEILLEDTLHSLSDYFKHRYQDRCLAGLNETFKRQYVFNSEYNYTLYYYDEAGNLHRTVAPNGVAEGTGSSGILNITQALAVGTTSFPLYSNSNMVNERYVNEYRYNSYNEPLNENTVDGGLTTYFYDKTGRIVLSQNAKQAGMGNVYSYSLYDDIGRIKQVGQITTSSPISSVTAESTTSLNPILTSTANVRTEVTSTYYDNATANATVLARFTGSVQAHLRNRVAYIHYEETDDNDTTTCDKATFYSYDDHGNVAELVQYIKALEPLNKGVSKVAYEYEIVSGNMIKASYEPNMPDQFMHKYGYDADNRLHEVFTSKDDMNWDRDAKYFYYEHGPLARIERADKQVQGTDYFYTIHGWIKGINSDAMQIHSDAGKDAALTNVYLSAYSKVHGYFANDAMAFSLGYYNKGSDVDYKAINNANFTGTANINPIATTSNVANATFSLSTNAPSLYNGNISSMVTGFINKDATTNQTLHPVNSPFPQLTAFHYDQLHRITQMKAYSSMSVNAWNTPTVSNYDGSYFMNFSYDANGNLLSLRRDGVGSTIKAALSLSMDVIDYKYRTIATGAAKNYNQLINIQDAIGTGGVFTEDIKAPTSYTGANRYDYDNIGNLIKDEGEYIATIEWTVDRKVKKITRDPAALATYSVTKDDIEYEYDGMRRRVAKIVKPRDPSTKALMDISYWRYTYYNYDAGGNVMATYERTGASIGGPGTYIDKLSLHEHNIFGGQRLAVARPATPVEWTNIYTICGSPTLECRTYTGSITTPTVSFAETKRRLGYKEFEMGNHLGNVIATVSDRKIQYTKCKTINNNPVDPDDPIDNTNYRTLPPTNAGTVIAGGLEVTPTARYGGVNQSFTMAVSGNAYVIGFDINIGTTVPNDSLYAKLYGLSALGAHGSDSAYVLINSSGHYELTYTAEPQTMNFKLYYNGIGTSGTRHFNVNNIIIADPIPVDPGLPNNPVNTVGGCNPLVGADLLHYFPDVLMHTDYYAFGQQMPGRTWNGTADAYRYSMNGQEKETEIFAGANSAEFWMYDSRIGRRWNLDPVMQEWQSPYSTFNDNPIYYSDLLGAIGNTNNPSGGGDKKTPTNDKGGIIGSDKDPINYPEIEVTPKKDASGGWVYLPSGQNDGSSGNGGNSGGEKSSDPNNPNPKSSNSDNLPIKDQLGNTSTWSGVSSALMELTNRIEKAQKLLSNGQFEAIVNNKIVVLSTEFYKAKKLLPTISKEAFYAAKAKYIADVAKGSNALKVVKATGIVGGVIGVAVSVLNIVTTEGDAKAKDKASLGMGVLGFVPGGAIPSCLYFVFDFFFPEENDFLQNSLEAGMEARREYAKDPMNAVVCFKAGTLIYTTKGLVPIEKIIKGDSVFSLNTKTKNLDISKISLTLQRKTSGIYRIIFNSDTVYATAEHPFYVRNIGWIPVKNLKIKDVLISSNKTEIEILSNDRIEESVTVFNLEVEENHNYFITKNKVLVHNKKIIEPKSKKEIFTKKRR